MTQMLSMVASEQPVQKDRRGSTRALALFRPGLVETERDAIFFCLIRNISPTGLMATVYAPVAPNQLIRLRLSETMELYGEIVWCEDDRIGVKFEQEIDVTNVLSELASDSSKEGKYRAPRVPIHASAQFFVHSQAHAILIRDVSQRGLKADAISLNVGDSGTLVIPGLKPRKAVVRWLNEGVAGFYFIEPIGFAELGQWILDRHHWDRQERNH